MQVFVENTGGLERRMTVQVPAERIDQEVTSRLQSMKASIRLDGFRPGKVPLQVVEKKYGTQVRQEVIEQVINSTLHEALTQENIRPAGEPLIDPREAKPGEQLEFIATFEVFPEIEGDIQYGFKVIRPIVAIGEDDISSMLEKLRKQRATGSVVDRKAQIEDQVVIDFEGSVDGNAFTGNKGEQFPVVLGSNSMIPGFEDQLVGSSAGDETTIKVTFPDDYPAGELAGKDAEFKVKVHSVSEMVLPALDDDFARAFGMEDKGLEGLKAEVTNNLQRELNAIVAANLKDQLFSGLLENNPVEVPRKLVDNELQQLQSQNEHQGADAAQLAATAERRVKLGVILSEVIKQNQLQVDPDRVRKAIETIAASYEKPEEVVQYYYGNQEMLAGIQSAVMEDQVVDWMVEYANLEIQDEQTTFDALVEAARQTKG
ncbi:MAG: trigger factor [Gammaproteobacteria bacterium]|nr:MAG: trigger factor [Gammaproteobacteria bacterium]